MGNFFSDLFHGPEREVQAPVITSAENQYSPEVWRYMLEEMQESKKLRKKALEESDAQMNRNRFFSVASTILPLVTLLSSANDRLAAPHRFEKALSMLQGGMLGTGSMLDQGSLARQQLLMGLQQGALHGAATPGQFGRANISYGPSFVGSDPMARGMGLASSLMSIAAPFIR